MCHVDSSVNIHLDLNYRQKQNGGNELKKVFAEKYYKKSKSLFYPRARNSMCRQNNCYNPFKMIFFPQSTITLKWFENATKISKKQLKIFPTFWVMLNLSILNCMYFFSQNVALYDVINGMVEFYRKYQYFLISFLIGILDTYF